MSSMESTSQQVVEKKRTGLIIWMIVSQILTVLSLGIWLRWPVFRSWRSTRASAPKPGRS